MKSDVSPDEFAPNCRWRVTRYFGKNYWGVVVVTFCIERRGFWGWKHIDSFSTKEMAVEKAREYMREEPWGVGEQVWP